METDVKKGHNGKPITVQNIGLGDYVQFVSITNRHQSDAASYAYSGTSGGTWIYQARSKTPSN